LFYSFISLNLIEKREVTKGRIMRSKNERNAVITNIRQRSPPLPPLPLCKKALYVSADEL
jgi:hypothetical protein